MTWNTPLSIERHPPTAWSASRGAAAAQHDLRPAIPLRVVLWDLLADAQDLVAGRDVLVLILLGAVFARVVLAGLPASAADGSACGVLALAPGTTARVEVARPGPVLVLQIDERLIRESPLPLLGRNGGHARLRAGLAPASATLTGLAAALAEELRLAPEGTVGRRVALMLALVEYLASDPLLIERRAPAASSHAEGRVQHVLRLIDENLSRPLSLTWLASHAAISPFHLSRSFRQVTGRSIQSHIRDRRLQEACRLLASTRRSLAEIAYECGFSSQSRMTTVFRQTIDMTPLGYRTACWNAGAPRGRSPRA